MFWMAEWLFCSYPYFVPNSNSTATSVTKGYVCHQFLQYFILKYIRRVDLQDRDREPTINLFKIADSCWRFQNCRFMLEISPVVVTCPKCDISPNGSGHILTSTRLSLPEIMNFRLTHTWGKEILSKGTFIHDVTHRRGEMG